MYGDLKLGHTIGDSLLHARTQLFNRTGEDGIDWAAFSLFGNPDSRLYHHVLKQNVIMRRIQITMSNEVGTLGRILMALGQHRVNIVQGRSITLDDERTAGYIAEVELPLMLEEPELKATLAKSSVGKLVYNIRFLQ